MAIEAHLHQMRWRNTLTFLGNGFGIGVWSIEIAPVRLIVGVSEAVLGLALFGFAAAALLGMRLGARMSDRWPINRVCGGLGLAFAVALFLPCLARDIGTLVVSLILLGATNGTLDVAMNARGSLIENRYDRPIMSSFHAAWSIGGAAGAALAGVLTGFGFGPVAVLSIAALLAAVSLAVSSGAYQPPAPIANEGSSARSKRRRLDPRLAGLCLLAFCALFTEGAIADWSSIYLQDVLESGFAIGFFAFSAGMSIGRLGGDRAVTRYGRLAVGSLGALIAGLAMAYVLWAPSLATACICFLLIGLGMSNVVPMTFSMAGRATANASQGIAMAASFGYTGFLLGPAVIGGLTHFLTLPLALMVLVMTIGVIALTSWLVLPPADGARKPISE
ncbi:MFS transporter [Halomonas sp. HP20-15]|uniref:MFS transporter n=1 Tax=Halomonas sp. HP20-15 TaxID=3085901 RepID=UPI002980A263|nr:MFS transporter [Halomonas sp. HP20-15]MDW5377513.1 MFS transporter [Halomonas sp. HP20-15]